MDAVARTLQRGRVIMRLIDADKLIRRMRIDMDRMKYQYNLDVIEGMRLAIGYIVGRPTAYDTNEVIKRIESIKEKWRLCKRRLWTLQIFQDLLGWRNE